ncbi:MAG TPA: OmpA family protein, partial [Puia sp.]|nr:OmpA family protein [Puia sp.]
ICLFSVIFLSAALSLPSCVSTGKFNALQQEKQKTDSLYTWAMHTLKTCQDDNNNLNKQKAQLQDQASDLTLQLTVTKENNIQLSKQLQDVTALSSSQAESIKKSLDNIGAKDAYLRGLRSALSHHDSVNLAVLLDLKASLGGFADQGVAIKTEKAVVYVDLSDQLLFNNDSNSYTLTDKAKSVLGRLAQVLNDQPEVEFMVEGHTDSIAYPREILVDNWDRSVKRATAIVRVLQNDYNISPLRMTAAGRGEYTTVTANDTPEGRAANRRTRVVILPQLDRLLPLLERGQSQPAN